MQNENSILPAPKRTPWNKGKLIGAKPPLLARHVWPYTAESNLELGRLPCSADLGDRRPVSMASPCSLASIESIFMYIIIKLHLATHVSI
jgi:hypothetical protein